MQKQIIKKSLPPKASNIIKQLGEHIKIARKRRGITMQEMASRMFVTRKTLSRLENGEPGVSLAVFVSALWVLGLEDNIRSVAHPENDKVGIFYERKRLPKRIRSPLKQAEPDF